MWELPLFPEQASTIAHRIDLMYFVLIGLGSIFGFGVSAVLIYFAVKYRAAVEHVDRSNATTDNLKLEAAWSLIPLGLAMGMFFWGSVLYYEIQTPPVGEAIEIYAVGQQWMWKFQHSGGPSEINALHVPSGRTVRMIMTSQDVIHSFFVPAFRVKQDVLPGRYTYTWFHATSPGEYHLFCTEYCGTQHSVMRGSVHVMEPAEYERWLRLGHTGDSVVEEFSGRQERAEPRAGTDTTGASTVDQGVPSMGAAGAELFERLRCDTCHRTDSSATAPSTGPVLEDIYGRRIRLQNGREIIADEQYLQESILNPYAKLVQGYPPIMPTYAGQISTSELMQLVAYLKSLSRDTTRTPLTPLHPAQDPATPEE